MKIDRVQTGVRLEKRLVGALNQLAAEEGQNLGRKLEEIVSHSFEGGGACAWSPQELPRVAKTREAFDLTYDVHALSGAGGDTGPAHGPRPKPLRVERIQVGFKMEKSMVKVLKGIAEMEDMKLGHVLEEIVLHQMEGVDAFHPATLTKIRLLQKVYGMDYATHATYEFQD